MQKRRNFGPIAFVLGVALVLTSCSWIMVRSPEPGYAPESATGPPDCTASLGPAIGDTWDAIAIGGGLVALGAVSLATSSDAFVLSNEPAVGITELGLGVGLGAMFGASALHGYRAADRCRQLRDGFQARLHERLDALERD